MMRFAQGYRIESKELAPLRFTSVLDSRLRSMIFSNPNLTPATQDQKATPCVAVTKQRGETNENERCNVLHRRHRRQRRASPREQVPISRGRGGEENSARSWPDSDQGSVIRTAGSGDGRRYSRIVSERRNPCQPLQPRSESQDVERHSRQDVERRELRSDRRSLRLDVGDFGTHRTSHRVAGSEDREAFVRSERRRCRSNYAEDFGEADGACGLVPAWATPKTVECSASYAECGAELVSKKREAAV